MNSADQGVFPMDTAFKRRWEFEYVPIDNGWDVSSDGKLSPKEWTIAGTKHEYEWNEVRVYVNNLLSDNGVNEDKLMGAHFVSVSGSTASGSPLSIVSQDTFKSKVLMYLWEDAARMCRQKTFADASIKTFSKLLEQWDEKGMEIFNLYKTNGKDAIRPKDLKTSGDPEGTPPPPPGTPPDPS